MNLSRLLVLVVCSLAYVTVAQATPPSEQTRACVAASTEGQTDRDEGRLLAARGELRACARASCPAIVAKSCGDWLAELEQRIPSVVLRVIEAGAGDLTEASVKLDQQPVALDGREVWLDPGRHEVVAYALGWSPIARTFLVAERERARVLTIELPARAGSAPAVAPALPSEPAHEEPAARPRSEPSASAPRETPAPRSFAVPAGAWVLAGVGVAGMVGFAVLGTQAKNEYHRLSHDCSPGCTPRQTEAGERKALLADVSLGVGAAALLGAGAWTLSRWLQRERPPDTQLGFAPTHGGVLATVFARY